MQTYGRVITGISFTTPGGGGGGGGGITNVTLDNSLFVSKDGNNTTAQPYSLVNKYLTIQAAINDAASGETVFVYPGTYTENLTISGGIRVHFFLGAIVDGQIDMDGGTNYITGNGEFKHSLSGHTLHIFGGSSSNNYVECDSIESGGGVFGNAVRKTGAGFGQVNCKQLIGTLQLGGPVVQVTTGILHLYCDVIKTNTGFIANDIIKIESDCVIECNLIIQSSAGARSIYATSGNSSIYFNTLIGYVEIDDTANCNIRGKGSIGTIRTNPGSTLIAPIIISSTSCIAKVGNMMLAVQGSTGTSSVYSGIGATIILNGIISSNKNLDGNVRYSGSGVFVVDPNMDVINS